MRAELHHRARPEEEEEPQVLALEMRLVPNECPTFSQSPLDEPSPSKVVFKVDQQRLHFDKAVSE
jgi:hypothetical protein